MSLLQKILGKSNTHNSENNQIVENCLINIILSVEKSSDALGIFNCIIQVRCRNTIHVCLKDWYDGSISKYGNKYGLDTYFNLTPTKEGFYESTIPLHIDGTPSQFMQKLKNTLETQYHLVYHYDSKLLTLSKTFR